MQWREDGVQYKEAKTRLDGLKPDESVEKKHAHAHSTGLWQLWGQLDR
jgi:hypothetical protein